MSNNDCFCCESLRLLSWVFCGDRLTNNQRLLLLRILAASVVSLLRWSPDEQLTIAFTANPCGFCGDRVTNNWRLLLLRILAASVVSLLRWSRDEQLTIALAANPCSFCRESFAVIAWRTIDNSFGCESLRLLSWVFCGDRLTNNQWLLLLRILAASVVSLLQWSLDEQPTIAFAANPCGFCRESFAVIAWRTIDDCICCESLRLLSSVFCGDRLTNNWRLLLLRILAASVVSLLRWSLDRQPTIAFAANPCGFCRESFAVIAWRTIDDCFSCESLRLLSWVFCGDRLTNNQWLLLLRILAASVVSLLQWSLDEQPTIAFAANPCGFCRESFAVIAWRTIDDCICCESLRLLSSVFCGDRLTNNWRLLLLRILAASVVSLLRWSLDRQPTIAFAANPCGFCRESFAVIAWRTIDDCFSCESLRLLSWVFCGDRLTNNWRLLLLRILAASVVSLLRWSPDKQPTIAFTANPCGFCPESFAVIAWRTTNDCFCCESLRLLSWVFCGDRVTNNWRLL